MALDIKGLKRVFILKKGNGTLTLEDPDSRMSLSEVTDFYSMNYPELTRQPCTGRNSKRTARYTGSKPP